MRALHFLLFWLLANGFAHASRPHVAATLPPAPIGFTVGALAEYDFQLLEYAGCPEEEGDCIPNDAADTVVDWSYDAFGRKVAETVYDYTKTIDSQKLYVWDGWRLVAEVNGVSGDVVAEYVPGPGYIDHTVAARRDLDRDGDFEDTNEGWLYYLTDQQFSTVALLDDTGAVVERYSYDAFGAPSFYDGSGDPIAVSAYGNNRLYTGREWLPELGLYDYRQRLYNPNTGRFLTRDPVYDPANLGNPYTYVGNNPGAFVDPYGLWGIRFGQNGPNIGIGEATLQIDRSFIDFSQGDYENMEELVAFIPVIGWAADARILEREWSRGQYVSASITALGFIPVLGDATAGILRAADKGVGAVAGQLKAGKAADAVAEGEAVAKMRAGREFDRAGPTKELSVATQEMPKGGTYVLRDPATGQVMRTGRTKDFGRRQAEHLRDPQTEALRFQPVHRTTDLTEQRGLEQILHDQYNAPLNRIRPISPRNPSRQHYLDAAEDFLGRDKL